MAAGVSLRSVAKEIGVSHVFLGDVERGKYPIPPKHFAELARAIPGWSPSSDRVGGPARVQRAPDGPPRAGSLLSGPRAGTVSQSPAGLSDRAVLGPPPRPPPPPSPARITHAHTSSGPAAPGASLGDPDEAAGPREIVLETLRVLRARLRSAPPSEVTKVTREVTSATKVLARLDGSLEVTQGQIRRSPYWRALMLKIEKAIEPFPDAVRAFAKAFEDGNE
jgi:hypothetical protein